MWKRLLFVQFFHKTPIRSRKLGKRGRLYFRCRSRMVGGMPIPRREYTQAAVFFLFSFLELYDFALPFSSLLACDVLPENLVRLARASLMRFANTVTYGALRKGFL